jgi:mRNA interferase MazF
MTSFDFGDVVLVPFPFTDQSTTKRRPAVVVSSNAYNAARPDVLVMAVTSRVRAEAFSEVGVHRWREAGLLKPSVLKPLIATIEKRAIRRRLGRLHKDDLNALSKLLGAILG